MITVSLITPLVKETGRPQGQEEQTDVHEIQRPASPREGGADRDRRSADQPVSSAFGEHCLEMNGCCCFLRLAIQPSDGLCFQCNIFCF